MRLAFVLLLLATTTQAQWQLQQSNTIADLRGIHFLGSGVAWASGSKGTVLRTLDNGTTWQPCAIPPGAEALDFRGVQAFNATSAIIMSSGTGELSRLYRTHDGCTHWQLIATNPDPSGFWDAFLLYFSNGSTAHGTLIGDPVDGIFPVTDFSFGVRAPSVGGGEYFTMHPHYWAHAQAQPAEALFAASNSTLPSPGPGADLAFVTGGPAGSRFLQLVTTSMGDTSFASWVASPLPLAHGASAGAFSLAQHDHAFVVVGGDYALPESSSGTSASSPDAGKTWSASTVPPHGYRSSVAYSAVLKAWITVGPNGTDVSNDDGRNWRALRPQSGEAPDADQRWNALSLPFVVGPRGRIGLLRESALKP